MGEGQDTLILSGSHYSLFLTSNTQLTRTLSLLLKWLSNLPFLVHCLITFLRDYINLFFGCLQLQFISSSAAQSVFLRHPQNH